MLEIRNSDFDKAVLCLSGLIKQLYNYGNSNFKH